MKLKQVIAVALVCGFISIGGTSVTAQSSVDMPDQEIIAAAIAKVSDSVVQIETIGGNDEISGVRVTSQPRTGTIVNSEGYIVTAAFNLAHEPTTIIVRFPDGQRLAAEIVAENRARNVTLLKVQADKEWIAPDFLQRSQLQVGQISIAVGRSMDLNQVNISTGIVSAVNRIWGKAIQTDAAISPHNFGGPLIDIQGNVQGVLVPMSPQGIDVTSGTEWYDSGIGFAVPLDELRLGEMVKGVDLEPGLLGVSFIEDRGYASPAMISASPGNSPAGIAGLKPGDEITRINGTKIKRVNQVRHALGPMYAGDTIAVQFLREGESQTADIQLVAEIEPWLHAMIGIVVDSKDGSMIVRQLMQGGPADQAGVKRGDILLKPNATIDDLESQLMTRTVDSSYSLPVERGGKRVELQLKLSAVSAEPLPSTKMLQAEASELVEVKIAELPNKCHGYFPKSAEPSGLLLWIGEPGEFDANEELAKWQKWCDETNTALLLPVSQDSKNWSPAEIEFMNKLFVQANSEVDIDPRRVAVGGLQTGGIMASIVAMSERETWRGLVLVDSNASKRIAKVQSEPASRQLVLMLNVSREEAVAKKMDENATAIRKQGFAVHRDESDDKFRKLIADWIATLDRL